MVFIFIVSDLTIYFFRQFTVLCEAKYLIMKPVTLNVHLEVSFALGSFTCAKEVHWITKGESEVLPTR